VISSRQGVSEATNLPVRVSGLTYKLRRQDQGRAHRGGDRRAERQFRELGRRDARDLAFGLIASYQGIALLTNAFRDPQLMTRETERLDRRLDLL
jgi:hypothetical protein